MNQVNEKQRIVISLLFLLSNIDEVTGYCSLKQSYY